MIVTLLLILYTSTGIIEQQVHVVPDSSMTTCEQTGEGYVESGWYGGARVAGYICKEEVTP